MSAPYVPPVTLLTLIADYIDAQDGSQKKKELLPLVTVHVNARIRAQHTLDAISAIVDKSRKRASERAATEHANKTAEADYKALQETLRASRQTPTRQNAIKLAHQAVIDAYNGRKKFEHSRRTIAENRIAHALAELDKKNKAVREQRKKDIEEAKREKKERKEEEKKEKEEKKATEKAEKKAADDKKKEQEAEVRVKRREAQAQQSLTLKAGAVQDEKAKKALTEQTRQINIELLKVLQFINQSQQSGQGRKRKEREEEVKSDSDKENVEPADE